MRFPDVKTFEQWRTHARQLLTRDIHPSDIFWGEQDDSLFAVSADSSEHVETESQHESATRNRSATKNHSVPKDYLSLAERVAAHRAPDRWERLYRVLWRLTHGERHLMTIETDDDVHRLLMMRKAVDRDIHKMKAFVRFRRVESEPESSETYVAWHRPDHRIVRLAAPFFSRRFSGMNWTILTPDESVTWDQSSLTYGPGVSPAAAPKHDELEELWKTYYASIFNPARIKVKAMKAEMPVRHWKTMPETELIPDLLQKANSRVDSMIDQAEGFKETATHFFPSSRSLDQLAIAASNCTACDLHCDATQTVFGVGPATASIMVVGEQPGDQEDCRGIPFIGQAGEVLDHAFAQASLKRETVYITNVVKHFKFKQTFDDSGQPKRRLHQKPSSREIYACRPWLEAEIDCVKPDVLICLGATAAQAILGRDFRITSQRGTFWPTDWCDKTIASWHPSAILRMVDPQRRQQMHDDLVADLSAAAANSIG